MAKVIVDVYDAVGGEDKDSFIATDGKKAGRTDEGEFVIAYCGRHTSRLYPYWGSIPWGTRMKEENGILKVYMGRRWQPLKNFTNATKDIIKDEYETLYGMRKLPDKWVFNDFGHMTCYYFKDVNRNHKLDKKIEHIHGEFIHTTPENEAQSALGKAIELDYSHGCIHVKPKDIDEMQERGYVKKGNLLVVHSYRQKAPIGPRRIGKAPFEFHFYPFSNKIVIFGNNHKH